MLNAAKMLRSMQFCGFVAASATLFLLSVLCMCWGWLSFSKHACFSLCLDQLGCSPQMPDVGPAQRQMKH